MRWSLSLAANDVTIRYKPGLNNQVPEALYRWIDEWRKEKEVQEESSTLEADTVLDMTRSQGRKETQPTPNEIYAEDIGN